jgi:hypothetical protein
VTLVFYMMKRLTFTFLAISSLLQCQAQLLVDRIKIACGNHYFDEDLNFNNPALIVRGVFCQDSYYWTPISEGDVLTEMAYLDQEPFSGICVDLDSNGQLLGKYTFKDGLIQQLEEYHVNGQLYKVLHYIDGAPHGSASRFTQDGVLDSHFCFENGTRSGYYYLTRDRTDWGLPPCIEFGKYVDGEAIVMTKPCYPDNDGE